MGHGAANQSLLPFQIQSPAPNSLEAILANAGWKMSFVDFSQAKPSPGSSWMFNEIEAHEYGRQAERITPAQTYDGVIYLDTVTPPVAVP